MLHFFPPRLFSYTHLVHWFRPFSRLPVAEHDPISISIDPRFAGKAANRHRVVRGRWRVMQDQSAASWRAVRHPRSSAPASDAATPPIGGARPTGTRQAGISTFAGNEMTLPPGTIVPPFAVGPPPGGLKKWRRRSAETSPAGIGSEQRSHHAPPRPTNTKQNT